MRKSKFKSDGSERVMVASWTFTATFINAIAAAAKADGYEPTAWVRMLLIDALKQRGYWPIPENTKKD